MTPEKQRCTVCGVEQEMSGTICEACNAQIRGEAAGKRLRIKKEADKALEKEGIRPKRDEET